MISETINIKNFLPMGYQMASQKFVKNMYTRVIFYSSILIGAAVLGFLALVTSFVWLPALFLSLPFLAFGYFLFRYTNVSTISKY